MASSQSSSIKSEERSLGSILADKRSLRVPAYQRSFSWTKAQINDLWEDIQTILYDGLDPYFLGSMVFIQKADNSLEVVDGQQRLATISLLLAAIRDGFAAVKDKERAQHVETHYICSRDLKSLEASPKLSLNETDNDLYCQIIDSKKKYSELIQISKKKELPESNRPNLVDRHHHPGIGDVLYRGAVVDPFPGLTGATLLHGADETEGRVVRLLESLSHLVEKSLVQLDAPACARDLGSFVGGDEIYFRLRFRQHRQNLEPATGAGDVVEDRPGLFGTPRVAIDEGGGNMRGHESILRGMRVRSSFAREPASSRRHLR